MSFIAGYVLGCVVTFLAARWAYKDVHRERDRKLLPLATEAVDELCVCDGVGKCPACRLWMKIHFHE